MKHNGSNTFFAVSKAKKMIFKMSKYFHIDARRMSVEFIELF